MLKDGYFSTWAFKTVGGTIIAIIVGGMLASWQSNIANEQAAHAASFEAREINMKQQQQIDSLECGARLEKIDRAVVWQKLESIEEQNTKTYELVVKLWEKSL